MHKILLIGIILIFFFINSVNAEVLTDEIDGISFTVEYNSDFTPDTEQPLKITITNNKDSKKHIRFSYDATCANLWGITWTLESGETEIFWKNFTCKEVTNFVGCLKAEGKYYPLLFTTPGGYSSQIFVMEKRESVNEPKIPIFDAKVTVYKKVNGNYVKVSEGNTNSEGYFYFDEYGSPDMDYKIIAQKSGYGYENKSYYEKTGSFSCYEYWDKTLVLESGYSETSQKDSLPGFETIFILMAIGSVLFVFSKRKKRF